MWRHECTVRINCKVVVPIPRLNTESDGFHARSRVRRKWETGYPWKTCSQLNRVANVRAAHGEELSDLTGVVEIGIGKDHVMLYVSDQSVEVPSRIEDVAIFKICI